MPTKENSSGKQQPYDAETGKFSSFSGSKKEEKRDKIIKFSFGDYNATSKTADFYNNFKEKEKKWMEDWRISSTKDYILNEKANFYKKYQEGKANKDNFYMNTIAEFKELNKRPNREPDFVSRTKNGNISSEYWYENDGVIRGSNHWGTNTASCDWFLDTQVGDNDYEFEKYDTIKYGKCNWDDFIHKTQFQTDPTHETNNAEISNFNNIDSVSNRGSYIHNVNIKLDAFKDKTNEEEDDEFVLSPKNLEVLKATEEGKDLIMKAPEMTKEELKKAVYEFLKK